jgi:hypothetical protein
VPENASVFQFGREPLGTTATITEMFMIARLGMVRYLWGMGLCIRMLAVCRSDAKSNINKTTLHPVSLIVSVSAISCLSDDGFD